MKKPADELTYDEVAGMLKCSPRQVRRYARAFKITPTVRGHRTVTFPWAKAAKLKALVAERGRVTIRVNVGSRPKGGAR